MARTQPLDTSFDLLIARCTSFVFHTAGDQAQGLVCTPSSVPACANFNDHILLKVMLS